LSERRLSVLSKPSARAITLGDVLSQVDIEHFFAEADIVISGNGRLRTPQIQGHEAAGEYFAGGGHRAVEKRLRTSGPVSSREIPDTSVVSWRSSGWTGNRNVTQMLEILAIRGEVAIAGRVGRERLWDLPERVYPADVLVPSVEEAERAKDERRLASLGIARPKGRAMPMEPIHVGEAGEPAVVEGTKGEWRVDPEALDDDFEGRTALLSPFDRLVHGRLRAEELFEFEYTLEMYKPEAKRRWGYFTLPILHHDQLVGKLDAKADRKASVLRVKAIHEDVKFTRTIATGVRAELEELASWLGLEAVETV
jgi:hypothetical protein